MRQPRQRGRLDALDGLRGLAATGVVALHVWMFDWGGSGRPPKHAIDYFFGEMRLGVALFFVLSGFLLYRPFVGAALDGRRLSLGRYALRRAARILPAYWLVLAGTIAIIVAVGQPVAADISRLPAFLGFAQNQVQEARHFNPPLWTIGVEVSFYLTLPLIALAAVRIGPRVRAQVALVAGLIAAGVVFTSLAAVQEWPAIVTRSLPSHLSEFGFGMLVAVVADRMGPLGRRAGLAVALTGAMLVAADGVWHSLRLGAQLPREAIADAPAAAGFALIVVALACAPGLGRWLTSAPLRVLGVLSYGIYLWHYPAIRLLRAEEWWPESMALKFAAVLGVAAGAATVSWFCVERPVMRWSARRVARSRSTAGAVPASARPRGRRAAAPARA